MNAIMRTQPIDVRSVEDQFEIATYAKMDIVVERGNGARVWTSDGQEYLDLYGGHAVCATGHSHPHVIKAIREQAERIIFYSNLVYSDIRAAAAEMLASRTPAGLDKVFFCNSGTEANENAMRMARMATGREKIVSFSGGFHGRTADAISATFLGHYRELGQPNVPYHAAAEFGDIDSVRSVIDVETAGVVIEPIQSMAGVREASPGFFIELQAHCDMVGAKLIFDEVQTGIGRTGSWFFSGSEAAGGVVPDMITLAKSLGSGIPVGACVVTPEISSRIGTNDLGTTFGGGMIAMAAVVATIEAVEADGMIENAKAVEKFIREKLSGQDRVRCVRGKGCLLGIEFDEPCNRIHEHLLENGIITGTSSDPKVLRLLPPLNTPVSDIDLFINRLP